ncbi:MAG: 6-carboxytetrahydropterin synthase QueD [Deltaproteobacteria bacterium]|nr:6-carboxytetrahydropterin synthase QueD [Deltaproteobacteria bacterium]
MYELTVISGFSAAHSLRGYEGECERLHGHNWRVEVTVVADRLDDIGLAIDFKVLKAELEKVLEGLDHHCLNDIPPFDTENPSSESIARFIFLKLSNALSSPGIGGIRVKKVKVWESEIAAAAYLEEWRVES